MFSGLFTQVVLIIVAGASIFFYVKPVLTGIGETQDQISVYQQERGQIESVNATLANKVAVVDGISPNDSLSLLTYMPDQVDPLAVMRDIKSIAEGAGLIVSSVADVGPITDEPAGTVARFASTPMETVATPTTWSNVPYGYDFTLSVRGSYAQIKSLLGLFESNNYPLEVHELNIQSLEGGFLSAEMKLRTYSHEETAGPGIIGEFQDVNVTYDE